MLLDNKTALHAAAEKARVLGFATTITTEISEQPTEDGCRQLIEQLKSLDGPACLLSGGEFSCPVRGDGAGGRNLETVLRGAQLLEGVSSHVVFLSAGTDGIDGNSPAAGAIADETTIATAKSLGLDADDFLERSDSFTFLEKLNATIVTGPTGTNVRDVRILLKEGAINR
jgi:glycerate-2-kinase